MRTRSIVRRSVALVAATTLVSGALASGMLATSALAAPGVPTLTSFDPPRWDNRSSVNMTLTGTNFTNTGLVNDIVHLTPVNPDPAHEIADFTQTASAVTQSTTSFSVKIDLSKAPTGLYKVSVEDPISGQSNYAASQFEIYGFGPANATGVAFGPDDSASDNSNCPGSSCPSRGAGALDITGSNIAVGATARFLKGATPDAGITFLQGNVNDSTNKLGDDADTGNGDGTADADNKPGTGYASTTLLQGNYSLAPDTTVAGAPAPGFSPGLHQLQIVNNDGLTTGSTTAFAQPWFTSNPLQSLSRTSVTKNTSNVVLTVTGQGIRAGSTLAIESGATKAGPGGIPAACAGITTGASSVGNPDGQGTYTTISVPVTVASCTGTAARGVTIVGPDGARFLRSSFLNVLPAAPVPTFDDPVMDAGYDVLGQGAHVGFGSEVVNIHGTNFAGIGETDVDKMVKFDFGDGVTTTTLHVFSGSAQVSIDVAPDAPIEERVVTATNPDGTQGKAAHPLLPIVGLTQDPLASAPLEIVAGPTVTKVSPPSLQPSNSAAITLTGTFNTSDTYTTQLCMHTTASLDCTDDPAAIETTDAPGATSMTFHVSTNNAAPGLRDLVVTDNANKGRVYCRGCMGVDSMSLGAPTSVPNTAPVTLSFQQATGIDQVTNSSTATLTRLVDLDGQGPISLKSGTVLTPGASGSGTATGTFDVTGVAPGQYSITVVKDPAAGSPTSWTCTGCLTVTGQAVTVSAITREPGGKAATGGQGASNVPLKIVGTNFVKGVQVTIADVTVHDLTVVSPTELSLQVDVPDDATAAAKTVTVTSGDGVGPDTGSKDATKTFTVTAKPANLSAPSPATYAQGAGTAGYLSAPAGDPVTVTITGDNFASDATLDLGPGITVTSPAVTQGTDPTCLPAPIGCSGGTADSLTATLAIAENAVTGKRAIAVVNGDGGRASTTDAFTVSDGPKVLSVANQSQQPVLLPDGVAHHVTVLGTGFTNSDATKALKVVPGDGVTIANVVVTASQITADITVATDAALGARAVGVTNGDKGYGSLTPVYVAKAPGTPASLALTPLGSALKATWTAPAGTANGINNGAPITGYHLTLQKVGATTKTLADVNGSTLTYTFTGLTNGASYTIAVNAVNLVGAGPAASRIGVAGIVTTLTNTASSKLVVAGQAVRFSGKLTASTAPVVGRSVRLLFAPSVGAAFSKYVKTNSVGGWSYVYAPSYTFSVTASFGGDSTYRPSAAAKIPVSVRAKVVITSPASTSTSHVGTTLKVTGYVSPNHAGTRVTIYRLVSGKNVFLQTVTLTSSSTFSFSGNPKAGTYVFRVYIPATKGNLANYSNAITVHRV